MYQRLSRNDNFSALDYVIVGSGIGGLTTAVFLSKAGKKVLVLERHYVPGGFSHTFKRKDGFHWDVGVHYVGNMDPDSSFLRKIFNYLTDDQLKWEYMGDVYDEVNIGSEKFRFVAGKDNLITELKKHFANESIAIDLYFKQIAQAAKYGSLFFLQKSFPKILQATLGWYFKKLFRRYSSRSTYDVLRSITDNEKLISVLCSQCGNYGLPPRKSSFAAHALIVTHFIDGGYYPKGGAGEISKTLIDVLQKNGGALRIKANVQDIVVENGSVTGVRVNDMFIPCKNVISNAGAQNTFSTLLHKHKAGLENQFIKNVMPSTGHLCLYIGLDRTDEFMQLPRHNVWFYNNYDFDGIIQNDKDNPDAPINFAYISFPSAKDPLWKDRKQNHATIQAIGVASYEWFTMFEDKTWMKRGEAYERMKDNFKNKMLMKLYELYPQIEGHVVCTEVSTPLSTKHFTNYQHGEIYGLEHSPERFNLNGLLPKSSIRGLYMVGQDIVTVGVGGALASGLLCATAILKFSMARQFRAIAKS